MRVEVFAAGSHHHAELPQADKLIELALTKANLTGDFLWKVRIDKMQHCDSYSPVIRILGYKDFGVIVRLKAEPNATVDHRLTVLVPNGCGWSAQYIHDNLKRVEKTISRNWRKEYRQQRQPVTTQGSSRLGLAVLEKELVEAGVNGDGSSVVAIGGTADAYLIPNGQHDLAEDVIEVHSEVVIKKEHTHPYRHLDDITWDNLRAVSIDERKLLFLLLIVDDVSKESCRNKDHWLYFMVKYTGWTQFLPRIISRACNELAHQEYLIEVVGDRNKFLRYELSDKGRIIVDRERKRLGIKTIETKQAPAPVIEAPAPTDYGNILRRFSTKAQELADLADAGARLLAIDAEKEQHLQAIKVLDEESARIQNLLRENAAMIPHIEGLMGMKSLVIRH